MNELPLTDFASSSPPLLKHTHNQSRSKFQSQPKINCRNYFCARAIQIYWKCSFLYAKESKKRLPNYSLIHIMYYIMNNNYCIRQLERAAAHPRTGHRKGEVFIFLHIVWNTNKSVPYLIVIARCCVPFCGLLLIDCQSHEQHPEYTLLLFFSCLDISLIFPLLSTILFSALVYCTI